MAATVRVVAVDSGMKREVNRYEVARPQEDALFQEGAQYSQLVFLSGDKRVLLDDKRMLLIGDIQCITRVDYLICRVDVTNVRECLPLYWGKSQEIVYV